MEWIAAALLLAEIVVLLGGVLARYVFEAPLVWSDELAGILFLWLSMLGRGGRAAAQRAHADDGIRRQCPPRDARLPRSGGAGGRPRLPRPHPE